MSTPDPAAAAATFDAWAAAGRDADMARGHRRTTRRIVESWSFGPDDVVVDVGCGNGWALRWCRDRGAGAGHGVDVSPGMVARAQALTDDPALRFSVGQAASLPLEEATASHVLSVEALYYTPDPGAALREWARVARPGGQLGIMVDLYAEAPLAEAWVAALEVDVHVLATAQLVALCEAAGWREVHTEQVPDPRPPKHADAFTPNPWEPTHALHVAARRAGSLVITARR
jgi:ubiquinone/menaquinone biosynthesis C-methylase UbiE